MPDRSDDYQLPSWPKTRLTRELWNAVFGDIAARLNAREELEASFELLQEQGIQAALDYIQVSVAPQLSGLQDAIASAQSAIDEMLQGNAPNALKLGGQLPGYYASAQALSQGLAGFELYLEEALGGDPEFAATMAAALADRYTKSQIDTLLSGIEPWAIQPIGSFIFLGDVAEELFPPPTGKGYRYVELTAGLTGAGGYNQGVLTSETVSGSAPSINATAVVSLAGSPFNGKTIRLYNTERRFLRPGSPGTLEESQNLAHAHGVNDPGHAHSYIQPAPGTLIGNINGTGTGGGWSSTGVGYTGISIQSSGGNEARPRNVGIRVFRRIK